MATRRRRLGRHMVAVSAIISVGTPGLECGTVQTLIAVFVMLARARLFALCGSRFFRAASRAPMMVSGTFVAMVMAGHGWNVFTLRRSAAARCMRAQGLTARRLTVQRGSARRDQTTRRLNMWPLVALQRTMVTVRGRYTHVRRRMMRHR
jgi:hypothetical protein